MPNKQFKSALRRLHRGVPLGTKGRWQPARLATFTLEARQPGKYRGVVTVAGYGVAELWESDALDTVRRIACGYYPSLCKHFGPARLYAGL